MSPRSEEREDSRSKRQVIPKTRSSGNAYPQQTVGLPYITITITCIETLTLGTSKTGGRGWLNWLQDSLPAVGFENTALASE